MPQCPYLAICRGGCPRDWTVFGPQGENYYCPAFQQFFDYALPRLRQAAAAPAISKSSERFLWGRSELFYKVRIEVPS